MFENAIIARQWPFDCRMFDAWTSLRPHARWLMVLLVFAYALAFQGSRPLYSPDEGRYTIVALNMLDSGDWLHPMLNDEVEHWSKPPLTYWSIAASFALLGHSEFAARLPSALAFALTIIVLLRMGRRFVPAQPHLPALIYASFVFPVVASNQVTTDSLLTLWEALQLAAFSRLWWATQAREQRNAGLLLWLVAALAFMTKGPPGLLMLAACAVFICLGSGWRSLSRLFRWDGVLVFLVFAGAWFAIVIARQPDLLRYFLVDEVVERVASAKFHRNGEWYGAFKIYLPALALGTLPWLVFAVPRLWKARHDLLPRLRENDETRLVACWIALPLLIFFLSRSRLPLYILPLFVPLALAFARVLAPVRLHSFARHCALALWCAAFVLIRILPAHLDIAEDDKALATRLTRILPSRPHEVLFVDTAPRYGLRFYLHSEIERLYLSQESSKPESEDIADEMRTPEGCRALLTPMPAADRLSASLRRHKVAARRLADARGYAVFAEISSQCPAYDVLAASSKARPARHAP